MKESLASIALPPWLQWKKLQAYMHSKRMLFNNPDPDGYLGTSPSAGAMDTGNSITYKYKQGSLSYLGRVSYNYADKYLFQFLFRSDASTKFAPAKLLGLLPGRFRGVGSFGRRIYEEVAAVMV